jgi:predicted enzyme related to lactoylglutathione lyase
MRPYPVIDSQDPERIVPFWSGLLNLKARADGDYFTIGSMSDGFVMVVQRVPEAKTVKNRVHLDVNVDDLDEGTVRVKELGGRWTEPGNTREMHGGFLWRCMANPEGNEFCIHQLPQVAAQ